MNDLLDKLRSRVKTLTIYDCDADDGRLEALAGHLAGYGVAVRTVSTEGTAPTNVCVFHQGEEILGATSLDDLFPVDSIEQAFEGGETFDADRLPFDVSGELTVLPGNSRETMVTASRQIERLALDQGEGTLRAGFQRLSVLANSARTRSAYERLADAGVDVAVYGTPDVDLSDQPFEVVADDEAQFENFWFLFYDGADKRGALVAREQEPDAYDAFWTVDTDTVGELIDMADEQYPELMLRG